MSRTVLAASTLAATLALTGVTAGAAAAAAPARSVQAATPIIVDHGDLTRVHVVLGIASSIALRFDECASCGYHWAFLKKPSKTLISKTSRSRPANNPPGVVGGSGKHVFTFTGLQEGATTAKVAYYPPGKDADPVRVVTIRLKVND
ncbi:MAG TPA: protease inhibitor I42 family protein [Sporichthya sp.]|nr:protease inhibitor I42 family protein [Sporichthya sp.]